MKQYRFDYIKENVDKWNPSVPRNVETIESLPLWVSTPWITLDEYTPPKDYYGEVVEDFDEWYDQRHGYCVRLAKEYRSNKGKGLMESISMFIVTMVKKIGVQIKKMFRVKNLPFKRK